MHFGGPMSEFCQFKGFSYYCKTSLCGVSEKSQLPKSDLGLCFTALFATGGAGWIQEEDGLLIIPTSDLE